MISPQASHSHETPEASTDASHFSRTSARNAEQSLYCDSARLVPYAPNVHIGGRFVLLQAMLTAWPVGKALTAYLAARAQDKLFIATNKNVCWVMATVSSRLTAEIRFLVTFSGSVAR